MKRLYILFLLPFICYECLATTDITIQNKVSLRTLLFLNDLSNAKGEITPSLANKYCLMQIKGTYYAGGLMMVDTSNINSAVSTWNAKVGTRAGNIFSVKIPVANFTGFIEEQSVRYFELDNKIYLKLDSVRSVTGVNLVQQGYNLPQGYSGKGVVFGDVDGGFDYTHPTFFDSTGTIYRVQRVWEQGNSTGTSPAGFGYGTEYATSAAILARQFSDSSASHGTHVSGIAAGSGGGTHGRYKGMAFEADLVFVAFTVPANPGYVATEDAGTTSGILDGIKYIYEYAQSVNEPAVVNLSLGSHLGPHDGSSLFDMACDALVGGPGLILVGAAGNEGSADLHYGIDFSTDTATKFSYVSFEGNSGFGILDAWGQFSTDFCLNFYFPGNYNSTGRLCASKNYPGTQTLVVTGSNKDTCYIQVTSTSGSANANQEPEILVLMQNDGWPGDTLVMEISNGLTGYSGKMNIWNDGYGNGNPFWGTSSNPNFFDGDDNISVGEIGGTGKSIISVGAFTSKNTYVNYTGSSPKLIYPGNVGAIASFSSMGPTVDGRIKPDIAAPGNVVVSAVNSYDPDYRLPGGTDAATVVDTILGPGRPWSYATLQGTSMATPCVSGIAALLLQFNPSLTQSDIKTILQENAIRDQDVLSAGNTPNNVWGGGKVDAYQALRDVTAVNDLAPAHLLVYPNPSQGYVTIVSANEPLQAQLYDITGRTVLSSQMSGGVNRLDVSAVSKGIYLLWVQQADKVYCQKLVVE